MIVEIFKETFMRRRAIRRLHLAYLAVYIVVYFTLLLVSSSTTPSPWCVWLFGWSGCLFPVLLTIGIFGGDIASGRMIQLVTKPIALRTLYLFRVIGVFLQCVVHLSICYALVFVAYSCTGAEVEGNLALWYLASLVIALVWVALSTTVSTFVSRDFNIVVVILGAIAVFILLQSAYTFAQIVNKPVISDAAKMIGIYCVPPIVLLFKLGMQQCTVAKGVFAVLYAIGMAMFYIAIGIVILNHREFTRERE